MRSCLLLVLLSLLVCISVRAFEVDAFNADSHAPILMEIESSLEELSQAIARGEVDASTLDEEQFELDEEFDVEADVEQKICPTAITCKPGYYPAKRPGYKPSQNGCGAEGTSWLSETVNRFLNQVPVTMRKCCNMHDICYGSCGRSRVFCDKSFLRCVFNAVSNMRKKPYKYRTHMEDVCVTASLDKVFYNAVDQFACPAYRAAQMEACVCAPRKAKFTSVKKVVGNRTGILLSEMRASCLLLVLVSLLVCMSVKAFEVDAFNADSHAPILMEIESSLEELSQAIARGEIDASTLDEEQFELDEEFDVEADVGASKCPTVVCKPGYYATKRPGYTPSKNGCGADGTSWLSTTVNRFLNQVPATMRQCCNAHDVCYGTCGRSRVFCDKEFLRCVYKSVANMRKKPYKYRSHIEDVCVTASLDRVFYEAVNQFACPAYKVAQMEACVCTKTKKNIANLKNSVGKNLKK